MACERFRDALADVAAGEPAPAGVHAHLASCEACRADLAALRRALAVADAEMAGLLAVEPTTELAVRIRQAVAESDPSPGRRFGWLWPAVAAAATLLVALAVVLGRTPLPEPRVAMDAPRPDPVIPRDFGGTGPEGSAVPADPSPADANAGARGGRVPARSRSVGRHAIPAEPEVLVSPGEAEALLRLVALVHRERLTPPVLGVAGQPSADLAELALIDIKPLEIVPLDPAETSGT
jgi:hypothetical protein